ncbi:MFS transporter [Verrucomicrobiota bacterium]
MNDKSKLSTAMYVKLSVMMFLQFFIWGAYLVPMGKYIIFGGLAEGLAENDVGGIIGNAYATNSIGVILAAFIGGLIADRFFSGQKVLGVLHLLGGGVLYLAAKATVPGSFHTGGFVGLMLGYSVCYMPTLGLVNSVSFDQMKHPDKQFPAIRVWGTIGWIVACVVVGAVLPKLFTCPVHAVTGKPDAGMTQLPFLLASGASILLGIYSFFLPDSPPKAKGAKVSIGKMIGLDAAGMFKNRSFAAFAICSVVLCIPLAVYYARANDYLAIAGIGNSELVMSFGQMSEILFMILLPFFLVRFGVKAILLGGMAAWVGRYFLFAYGMDTKWMLLLGVILHGICYDFFFVTGQIYTDKVAPREIRASAQGLIALLTYGAGMFIGNKFFPVVSAHLMKDAAEGTEFAWQPFWSFFAFFALAVTVLFFISFRDKTKLGETEAKA